MTFFEIVVYLNTSNIEANVVVPLVVGVVVPQHVPVAGGVLGADAPAEV